jgi:nitroreductase
MDAIALLTQRQSMPQLVMPAPEGEHLEVILKAGMRVPDHGGLQPWRFTLVEHDGLHKLADIFVDAFKQSGAEQAKLDKAAKMPFRAPLIIIVSSRFQDHPKVPKSEQLIAAACSVQAMQMAAFALGYGAMWRTGELAYNDKVKRALNISLDNEIVGFLYIGTPARQLPVKAEKPYTEFVSYL